MTNKRPQQSSEAADTPAGWDYTRAIERGQTETRRYLDATHTLLRELRAARQNLPRSSSGPPRDSFEAFCSEIGISPAVADRWLEERTSRSGRLPADDASNPPSASDVLHQVLDAIESAAPPPAPASEVMTLAESARFLRCDEAFLQRSLAAGELPAYSVDGAPRLFKADLVAWLRLRPMGRPDPDRPPRTSPAAPAAESARTRTASRGPSGRRPARTGGRGKAGRASWCTPEEQARIKQAILDELAAGAPITDAARTAGIAWATLTKWRRADAEFAAGIEQRRQSTSRS